MTTTTPSSKSVKQRTPGSNSLASSHYHAASHHRSSSSSTPRLTYCVLLVVSVLRGYVLSSSNLFLRRYYHSAGGGASGSGGSTAELDAPPHQKITLSASISAEISNSNANTAASAGLRGTTTSNIEEDKNSSKATESEISTTDNVDTKAGTVDDTGTTKDDDDNEEEEETASKDDDEKEETVGLIVDEEATKETTTDDDISTTTTTTVEEDPTTTTTSADNEISTTNDDDTLTDIVDETVASKEEDDDAEEEAAVVGVDDGRKSGAAEAPKVGDFYILEGAGGAAVSSPNVDGTLRLVRSSMNHDQDDDEGDTTTTIDGVVTVDGNTTNNNNTLQQQSFSSNATSSTTNTTSTTTTLSSSPRSTNFKRIGEWTTAVETHKGPLKSYSYNENATGIAQVCQDFASRDITFDNQGHIRREFSNSTCGNMWNGDVIQDTIRDWEDNDDNEKTTTTSSNDILHIHVVVAYCHNPLDWMVDQLDDLIQLGIEHDKKIEFTMTVYSKCGKEQLLSNFFQNATFLNVDDNVIVERLPNVGGCDHTYAYWMKMEAPTSKANYVFFLKDTKRDDSLLSVNGRYRSTPDMLRIASHRGFACGLDTNALDNIPKRVGYVNGVTSVYHDTKRLYRYRMKLDTYQRASVREGLYNETNETLAIGSMNGTSSGDIVGGTAGGTSFNETAAAELEANFASTDYKQMGPFVVRALTKKSEELCSTLPICNHEAHTFVQVCYGGTFAVTREQILNVDSVVYDHLVHILSRGNNIEEGHYVERSWAGILAPPITPEEREGLLSFANSKVTEMPGIFGALARTWVGIQPQNFTRTRYHQVWKPEVP